MKTEEIFFVVRIEVKSEHSNINETLQEMEKSSRFFIIHAPKVKVVKSEILTTQTRNLNNGKHGE